MVITLGVGGKILASTPAYASSNRALVTNSGSATDPSLICQPGGTCGTKTYFLAGDSCEGYTIGTVVLDENGNPIICVWQEVGSTGKGSLVWQPWEWWY